MDRDDIQRNFGNFILMCVETRHFHILENYLSIIPKEINDSEVEIQQKTARNSDLEEENIMKSSLIKNKELEIDILKS